MRVWHGLEIAIINEEIEKIDYKAVVRFLNPSSQVLVKEKVYLCYWA